MTGPPARAANAPPQLVEDRLVSDWDDVYASQREIELPWFSPTLDEEFDMALEHYSVLPKAGPVLDLGCGPGTVAIELARRGFEVHALDVSRHAIKMARKRAGPVAKQIQWSLTDMFQAEFPPTFQLVYDRGLYHSLPPERRRAFPEKVAGWLKPRGLLFLKAFSLQEPGDWGPHRIPEEEVRTAFQGFFDVVRVEHVTFPGTLDHDPKANFFVLRRRAGERSVK